MKRIYRWQISFTDGTLEVDDINDWLDISPSENDSTNRLNWMTLLGLDSDSDELCINGFNGFDWQPSTFDDVDVDVIDVVVVDADCIEQSLDSSVSVGFSFSVDAVISDVTSNGGRR